MRLGRARAAAFGYEPDRIGMMGFSAGGHLTATAGTRFDAGNANANDPIERVSSRPDFLILAYPVISFQLMNWLRQRGLLTAPAAAR